MTPSYNSFNIDNNGYQTNNEEFGLYVPKGSYAISNNTMYELNRDNPIKGFRGWITLSHSLFDEQTPTYNIKITIDGNDINNITSITKDIIIPININNYTNDIYDLTGRKITNTRNLHGLYIINGQKIYFR